MTDTLNSIRHNPGLVKKVLTYFLSLPSLIFSGIGTRSVEDTIGSVLGGPIYLKINNSQEQIKIFYCGVIKYSKIFILAKTKT